MFFGFYLSVLGFLLYFNIVSGESCLHALRRSSVLSDPPFTDGDLGSLPASDAVQAIITTYKFHCSCRITTWETYVHPASSTHVNSRAYDITFQVWRPSPTVQDDGCYSLVGENVFTRVTITREGYVQLIPPSNSIITAQSGDVVGYYTNSGQGPNEGIQLEIKNNDYSDNMIWYLGVADGTLTSSGNNACPYPVGTIRYLSSSTTAAPMLRISSDSVTCPISTLITPSLSSIQIFIKSTTVISPSVTDRAMPSSGETTLPSQTTTTIPNNFVQMTSDVTVASDVPISLTETASMNVYGSLAISNIRPLYTSIYPSMSGGTASSTGVLEISASPLTPQSTTKNSNDALSSTATAIISALAATTFISVFGLMLVLISLILIVRKIRKMIAINKEVSREARNSSNDFSIDQIELEYEVVGTGTPTTTEHYSTVSQVCNTTFAMSTNEAYVAHTEKIDDTLLVMKTNAAYATHKERD